MSLSKVHSQGNVPFSWENKPGISKAIHQDCPTDMGQYALKLPPPPCPSSDSTKLSGHHDLYIPLPPCPFQPLSKSSSRNKFLKWQEDPFLAAYKECTKNVSKGKLSGDGGKKGGDSRGRKSMSMFSCKRSCNVREDNLVMRSSHLPPITRESLLR